MLELSMSCRGMCSIRCTKNTPFFVHPKIETRKEFFSVLILNLSTAGIEIRSKVLKYKHQIFIIFSNRINKLWKGKYINIRFFMLIHMNNEPFKSIITSIWYHRFPRASFLTSLTISILWLKRYNMDHSKCA